MKGEKITNPHESARLLEMAKSRRTLLEVSMPGVPDIFFSAFLAINADDQFILLDEINTRHGHELFLVHKTINVSTKLNGIDLSFSSKLLQAFEKDGIAVYKIKYPESVMYLQQRQSYRINIGLGISIPVKMKREDGVPLYGNMINLSETGAGIALNSPCAVHMSEILPFCELRISEEQTIRCQLEIRYIKANEENKPQHIGGQFIGIDNMQQRELSKVVTTLQRDLMKHLPKNAV
jgi:c-di-GMP-binding flagellar brake protein YcgR